MSIVHNVPLSSIDFGYCDDKMLNEKCNRKFLPVDGYILNRYLNIFSEMILYLQVRIHTM